MNRIKNIWLFLAGLIVGAFACAFFLHPPRQSADWASWAQAVGTVAAIAGTYVVARFQMDEDKARQERSDRIQRAKDLLALQQLAAELAQMCVLGNFEKSNMVEGSVYPNTADEFQAIADTLTSFPVSVVTAIGQMAVVLCMRRIAVACAQIFHDDHGLGGDQFVSKHRTKFSNFEKNCRRFSRDLQKCVEEQAPGYFTDKLRTHL